MENQIREQAKQNFGKRILETDISGGKGTIYIAGEVDEESFNQKLPERAEVEIIQLQRIE